MEWSKYVETVVAFTIPFAADLFNLPIFFVNWKTSFKVLSSIFASVLYVYIRFSDPNTIPASLEFWWLFMGIALLLLLIYIALHIFYNKKVDEGTRKPIILIALFTFIIFYSTFTIGFSLLFQSLNYRLVKCKIVDKNTRAPVEDAAVTLYLVNGSKTNDYKIGQESDKMGKINRYISNDTLKYLKFYSVTHAEYQNIISKEIDESRLTDLLYIKLEQ